MKTCMSPAVTLVSFETVDIITLSGFGEVFDWEDGIEEGLR